MVPFNPVIPSRRQKRGWEGLRQVTSLGELFIIIIIIIIIIIVVDFIIH